ncbi:MAG: rod shape-determining protein MreD [Actinomycetota bacterium]
MEQTSVVRAALVVALGALLDAVIGPYLTFGWVSPHFTLIAIVFAVSAMGELHSVLLGFFGGILLDALGGGLFGVGALGGLLAATLSLRTRATRRKSAERLVLAQVVAMTVAGYGLIQLVATNLARLGAPPLGEYLMVGLIPDAVLNGVLAYLLGDWLLRMTRSRMRSWEAR